MVALFAVVDLAVAVIMAVGAVHVAVRDLFLGGGTHVDHAAVAGLTRDELVKLIRVIDMGGQFYSRQNTAFQPFTSDPVGAGTQF